MDTPIPKFGSPDESPLEKYRLLDFVKGFDSYEVVFDEMVFFKLLDGYIFKNLKLRKYLDILDEEIHRLFPYLRKFSYWQNVVVRKK